MRIKLTGSADWEIDVAGMPCVGDTITDVDDRLDDEASSHLVVAVAWIAKQPSGTIDAVVRVEPSE